MAGHANTKAEVVMMFFLFFFLGGGGGGGGGRSLCFRYYFICKWASWAVARCTLTACFCHVRTPTSPLAIIHSLLEMSPFPKAKESELNYE
ncbi:uncharacterized protein J3R85_014084 [Psidium guajava]|nr:uncharacterized protein J3R85_014084 [Psidium guajava]